MESTEKNNSLIGTLLRVVGNIHKFQFFLGQLVRMNILGLYKNSFIGLFWLFIIPIVSIFIWLILNNGGIIEPGDTDIPYPAYVLLSTSIWAFFYDGYRNSSTIINRGASILIMNQIPGELLIAETIIVHVIKFSIPLGINLIALLFFGVKFSLVALLFPLALIPLLLAGISIGLLVAIFRVIATDLSNIADEGMKLLMFLTPVVYSPKINIGWLSEIIAYNPLTYLIGFPRNLLTTGKFYEPQLFLLCSAAVCLLFLFMLRFYLLMSPRVLERLVKT